MVVRDVTRRQQAQRELKRLASTDPLTGAANRATARAYVDAALEQGRVRAQPVSLAMVDLDRFKLVNDSFGHVVGDVVLKRVADLLKQAARREDLVARWGGEELMAAFNGLPKHEAAVRLRQVLATLSEEEFRADDGRTFHVTFSGGVAAFPMDGGSFEDLYRLSDAALYAAKAAGRAAIHVHQGDPG